MIDPPWLQDALAGIRRMQDRLPHALLIHGPRGWGEERIANALALDLMHLDAGRDAREVAHPDLRWLQPEDGVIKVDSVRDVVDFLVGTPKAAGRKIAVIEDADRMNVNAANALLKSLEEPPPESFVALSTSAPERLLPTVRSRCQQIQVKPGAAEDVSRWLQAAGVNLENAGYLSIEYGGAPFAVLAAAERGQDPLWTALEAAARSASAARAAGDGLRNEDLVDLLERWLRIAHWLVREVTVPQRAHLVDFATEILGVRRAALVNTGLNRAMQLRRLLLIWVDVWRRASLSEAPRP